MSRTQVRLGRRFRLKDRAPSLARRRRILFAGFAVAMLALNARAFHLQVRTTEVWRERALAQHQERLPLSAPRGTIYDRNGIPLATSREMVKVAIAPREVKHPDSAIARLTSALGISVEDATRAVKSTRPWVVLPGSYEVAAGSRLEGISGIHFERILQRFYPHGALAREILGPVSPAGEPLGGIESEYDDLLRGHEGYAVVGRDASGAPIPGAMVTIEPAVPGSDIYLALDYELQQIADEAIESALESTGADGGDILLLDPRTGDILAAASRRRAGLAVWAAVTEPYEPGSTLKPFLVASLLAENKVSLDEVVDAGRGRLVAEGGRVITDVHGYDTLSVRDALAKSSNVVMARIASRLSKLQQYRYLRDFGFGTITGVDYPSESAGLLRQPDAWSALSQQSLAIGYEISVTPLQMALAYGALANGGRLMAPRVVLGARTRDGNDVLQIAPRTLRQVVPRHAAEAVAGVLAEAVETGTGRAAALGPFRVAGKTGTARRVSRSGGYEPGAYTASFAGFFPADDPEIVFVVKLDNPRGAYYGGTTAAPVLRETLAAALASRRLVGQPTATPVRHAEPEQHAVQTVPDVDRPSVRIELNRPRTEAAPDTVIVPDVRGLSVRAAVGLLHHAGLGVKLSGRGIVLRIDPEPGVRLPGNTVILVEAAPLPASPPAEPEHR